MAAISDSRAGAAGVDLGAGGWGLLSEALLSARAPGESGWKILEQKWPYFQAVACQERHVCWRKCPSEKTAQPGAPERPELVSGIHTLWRPP